MNQTQAPPGRGADEALDDKTRCAVPAGDAGRRGARAAPANIAGDDLPRDFRTWLAAEGATPQEAGRQQVRRVSGRFSGRNANIREAHARLAARRIGYARPG